ncbi:hypothetical protein BO85DRAFT_447243, partial [Aspergillus piperis CBS 112811]
MIPEIRNTQSSMNLTYLLMYLITHLYAACSMHCTYLPQLIQLSIPTSSEPKIN